MRNITRTFLRSDEMMTKYMSDMRELEEKGTRASPFLDWKSRLIKEFESWVIIENKYPYDAIAITSHLICTKREVAFKWELLTEEERDELERIKKDYLGLHYNVIWENLPKGQTVPGHFHLNLLVLKREEV